MNHRPSTDCAAIQFTPTDQQQRNERRTFWVVCLTAGTMLVEIIAGYLTGSMALLADGWHMATHAGALAISFLAYRFARSPHRTRRLTFGGGKIFPLAGYTSALFLAGVAILLAVESVARFRNPELIRFDEAIVVTVFGLLINLASAFLLKPEHAHHPAHDHSHETDHNLRGAYLHVVADLLTSVLALIALAAGRWTGNASWDAWVGVLGAIVILRWAIVLVRDTASELLDVHAEGIGQSELERALATLDVRVDDFHVWRLSPQTIACEVVLTTRLLRGAQAYRDLLLATLPIQHLVVEERLDDPKAAAPLASS